MKYNCPHCGKRYDIRDDYLKPEGTKLRCRDCKGVMVIKPPRKDGPLAGLPMPPVPGSLAEGEELPPADRQLVRSIPPAGGEAPQMVDLPVAAGDPGPGGDSEFEFDPSPARGVDDASLPVAKQVGDLDEAFELADGPGDVASLDEPALPAPVSGSGDDDAFELDLPSPPTPREKAAPSAKAAPPIPRVGSSKGASPKQTLAGMPSIKQPPSPPPAPAGGAGDQNVGDLEDPFGAMDLPAPARSVGEDSGAFELDGPDLEPEPEPRPPALKPSEDEEEFGAFDLAGEPALDARPPVPKPVEETGGVEEFELPGQSMKPTEPLTPVSGVRQPTPIPPVLASPSTPPPAPSADEEAGAPPVEGGLEEPFGSLDLPAPRQTDSQDEPFGEFGMPAPPTADARPPVPKPEAEDEFGDMEIADPEPLTQPAQGIADDEFASLDLPTPARPSQDAEMDLPTPADAGQDATARDDPFGVLDAPSGSPPAGGGFGEIDLPTTRDQVKPVEESEDPFAALDMPPATPQQAPPSPVPAPGPEPEEASEKEPGRDIFAEITDEVKPGQSALPPQPPPPAPSAPVPGPSPEAGEAADDLASDPLDAKPHAAQATGSAGGTAFGEISLGGEEADDDLGDLQAGVDLPDRKYPASDSEDDSHSLDLDALGSSEAAARTSAAPAVSSAAPPTTGEEARPKKRLGPLIVVLVFLLVVAAGVAVWLTGLYVPIYRSATKLIPGRDIEAIEAERTEMLASISESLASDHYGDYSGGIERLQAKLRSRDDQIVSAYVVYLAYSIQLRFGGEERFEKIAERQLRKVKIDKEMEREELLAISSQKLFLRQDMKSGMARLGKLQSRRGGDRDALALMGLGALENGDGKAALDAYEKLARIEEGSPRSVFGKVRALVLSGRNEEAEEVLGELMKSDPGHVGAQILKSKLLLQRRAFEQAEVLLGSIDKTGDEKLAPGQASTVHALVGRIHLERGQNKLAMESFEKAMEMDPENVDAILGLATVHFRNKEYAKALGRYKMAVANQPTNLDATLGIASCHIELDEYAEAKKIVEDALAENPGEYRVHHVRGKLLKALGEMSDAEEAFEKSKELNPAFLDAYLDLARLYFDTERVSDAIVVLEEAKSKLPPTANLYAAFGKGYMERGDLDGALAELEQALEEDPEHIEAHYLKGIALYKMGEYAGSREILDWVEEQDSGFPGLVLAQGLLFEAMGELDRAEAYYNEALAADPDDTELQIRTASVLVANEKWGEAREILEKVIVEEPNNPEALYYLGRVELGEDKPVVALKHFKNAIRIQSDIGVYHMYKGLAEEASGNFSEALQSAHKAIEYNDDLALAYLVRGRIYVRMGTVKDGQDDLLHALELDEDLHQAYAPLGKSYEVMRKWKDAVVWYRKAIDAGEADGAVYTDLGLILFDHGGRQEAHGHFKKAYEMGHEAEGSPKWFFTSLYYIGRIAEEGGDEGLALQYYEEYLDNAPTQAIDRDDVEKRVEKIKQGY